MYMDPGTVYLVFSVYVVYHQLIMILGPIVYLAHDRPVGLKYVRYGERILIFLLNPY